MEKMLLSALKQLTHLALYRISESLTSYLKRRDTLLSARNVTIENAVLTVKHGGASLSMSVEPLTGRLTCSYVDEFGVDGEREHQALEKQLNEQPLLMGPTLVALFIKVDYHTDVTANASSACDAKTAHAVCQLRIGAAEAVGSLSRPKVHPIQNGHSCVYSWSL